MFILRSKLIFQQCIHVILGQHQTSKWFNMNIFHARLTKKNMHTKAASKVILQMALLFPLEYYYRKSVYRISAEIRRAYISTSLLFWHENRLKKSFSLWIVSSLNSSQIFAEIRYFKYTFDSVQSPRKHQRAQKCNQARVAIGREKVDIVSDKIFQWLCWREFSQAKIFCDAVGFIKAWASLEMTLDPGKGNCDVALACRIHGLELEIFLVSFCGWDWEGLRLLRPEVV